MLKLKKAILFCFAFIICISNIYGKSYQNTISDSIATINIADVNYKIEKAYHRLSYINSDTDNLNDLEKLNKDTEEQHKFLIDQKKEFETFNHNNLSNVYIKNTNKIWLEYLELTENRVKRSSEILKKSDKNTLLLIKVENRFNKIKQITNNNYNYNLVNNKINILLDSVEVKKSKHYMFMKKVIKNEYKIQENKTIVNEILIHIHNALVAKNQQTMYVSSNKIWEINYSKSVDFKLKIKNALHENIILTSNYIKLIKPEVSIFILFSLFIYALSFTIRKFYVKFKINENSGNGYGKLLLINNPIFSTITLILLVLINSFSYTPMLIYNFIKLLTLATIYFSFKKTYSADNKALFKILTIILVVNYFEMFSWYFGNLSRIYLFIESALSIILLSIYFKRKLKNKSSTIKITLQLKKIIPILIALYIIALIANILGYINFSVLLNKILIRIPVISIVLSYAIIIIKTYVKALLDVIKYNSRIIRNILDKNESKILVGINFIAAIIWINLTSYIIGLDDILGDYISGFMNYPITFADNLLMGDLISFIIVMIVTIMLSNVISKIFDDENFVKSKDLPRGTGSAVSLTLRIILSILGIMLSISYTGIDIGKFSVMAGALGVGIGFGLQDLVKNFISGLILIYGRPIQIGDTIEVNNLLGKVKMIGIRSSHITTFDGAEVIVPNSILISNQLINWTLSDSRTRIIIKIGTAYGSDPNMVLKLIKESATEVSSVLKNPEPYAIFTDFGDSSVNFEIRFWTFYDDNLNCKSNVAINIYNKLHENGIEIPFPQVDVNMKNLQDNIDNEDTNKADNKTNNETNNNNIKDE
ncbi:MAG: mechanosensitive ion channel [Ichthyobacteriaceae bacterium]|nr:mechanosensitive ion channel [Ichthyobacteriaceae bacterium]